MTALRSKGQLMLEDSESFDQEEQLRLCQEQEARKRQRRITAFSSTSYLPKLDTSNPPLYVLFHPRLRPLAAAKLGLISRRLDSITRNAFRPPDSDRDLCATDVPHYPIPDHCVIRHCGVKAYDLA